MFSHSITVKQFIIYNSSLRKLCVNTSFDDNKIQDNTTTNTLRVSKAIKINIEEIFILKGFRTIVFIFIVISTTFRPICPPAFFRCLSNSRTFTELRTTSFIETTWVASSDSVSHNRVQMISIPALLLACSED